MPLYTAITQEGTVSGETKAKIAEEITRIHTYVMKVPKNFVLSYFFRVPKGLALPVGPRFLRPHSIAYCGAATRVEEKADMLKQLWAMFQDLTGIATDQLVLSPQEIPSSNAMEMGQITQANDRTLRRIAAQLADKPFYPLTSTCCAFAGDRGLLHEELTRSATHDEVREVMHQDLDLYICVKWVWSTRLGRHMNLSYTRSRS